MTKKGNLNIAVAQFPVSNDIGRNLAFMKRQIKAGAKRGADLIQFPECSLTGYLSRDFSSFDELDWKSVQIAEAQLSAAAAEAGLWVVFGSYRRYRTQKPFNCLRVVSPKGMLVQTYDKYALFDRNGEAAACSPGRKLRTVVVNGVLCGLLICNDSNREFLYQRYRKLGVQLLIHSYYNARGTRGKTPFDDIILGQLRMRAYDHKVWISASNSSSRYSPLSACVAAPNGSVVATRRHQTSLRVVNIEF